MAYYIVKLNQEQARDLKFPGTEYKVLVGYVLDKVDGVWTVVKRRRPNRSFQFEIFNNQVPKIRIGDETLHVQTLTYNWVTKTDKIVGMSANTAIVSGYLRSRGDKVLIFKLDFNTMTYEEL